MQFNAAATTTTTTTWSAHAASGAVRCPSHTGAARPAASGLPGMVRMVGMHGMHGMHGSMVVLQYGRACKW